MTRHAALVLALAWAVPCVALPPPQNPSLDRVRRELASVGPLRMAASGWDENGRPVFRARVDEVGPRAGWVVWDPAIDTEVASYVRPRFPGPHYEFLQVVTPQEFRASTVPAGIDVLGPGDTIVNAVRTAWRRRAQDKARRRIKQELSVLKKERGRS